MSIVNLTCDSYLKRKPYLNYTPKLYHNANISPSVLLVA